MFDCGGGDESVFCEYDDEYDDDAGGASRACCAIYGVAAEYVFFSHRLVG